MIHRRDAEHAERSFARNAIYCYAKECFPKWCGRPCAKKSLASLMVKVHIEKGSN